MYHREGIVSIYKYFYLRLPLCRGRTFISCGFGFHAGVEVVVPLFLGDEFVVGTLLYDPALLQNYDIIRVADR